MDREKSASIQAGQVNCPEGSQRVTKDLNAHARYESSKMTFRHFLEGAVKRSDGVVSGAEDGEMPWDREQKAVPKTSSFDKTTEKLAARANVPVEQVKKAWVDARNSVAPNHPNRFAIIMSKVKKQLGLSDT